MTDDPIPSRSATSDDFRRAVQTAGDALKGRLETDLKSAAKYKGFLDFKLQPYEDLLREVLSRFEEDEFPFLHGGGDLVWRTIRLITEDASLDKSKYSETPGNPWALPLLVGAHGTIGQPQSLLQSFDVKQGDILLGYNIRKT